MNSDRKREVVKLKAEIKVMLKELGISMAVFKKTLPRMKARGYKYFVDNDGRKSSLRQRYTFLKDLVEHSKTEQLKVELTGKKEEMESNA